MKDRMLKQSAAEYISIIGALGSIAGLFSIVVSEISYSFIIALFSVIFAFFVGIFSKRLSKSLRRISIAPRIFLAYNHSEYDQAIEIANILRKNGAKVWIDKQHIGAGDSILNSITKAIDNSDFFVVLFGKNISSNLKSEIEVAAEKNKKIIPVIIKDTVIPSNIKGLRYVDLLNDRENGINELLEAIR